MRMLHRQPVSHSHPARGGATLTEVLMAVMLSGIGIVTLAVLFPISILRSIQATQLTNATILRYNAESVIDLDRNIVFDPDADNNVTEHLGKDYLFDPLGLNNGLGGSVGALTRFRGTYNTPAEAAGLVTLPDSFVFVVEEPGVTVTTGPPDTITFPTADLANIPAGLSRVTCFSRTGRHSVTRAISGITGNVVELQTPLPAGFGVEVEKARIETGEQRYTWLLTIRRQAGGTASIDVVVFFRRAFGPEEDTVYSLGALGGANPSEFAFKLNDDVVTVDYTAGNKPFYKKGGFILDAENGFWYQIEQVEEIGSTQLKITIDKPAIEPSDQAVFMRGIVDVFPIGTKT